MNTQNIILDFGWGINLLAKKLLFRAGKGQYVFAQQSGAFILVKPTTYMNDSGIAVREASRYFEIETEDILLVYDDIDLPLGTLRFRSGGGSGGHKGVGISHLSFTIR